MDETQGCQGCGQDLPPGVTSGHCPACSSGFIDETSSADATITFGPASHSVLTSFGEAYGKITPVLLRDADSISDPGPVIRPSSTEIPEPSERSARLLLFGEIARGGMGAVLKGRDSDLGRDLAVKVLLEAHRDHPDMVRRFIEEAQIAGQLQHPGIVPVYELGAFGDRRPYFAMKLVKGLTLAELLATRKGPADDLTRFLAIFESICQTMAYAHARGVIHRDLKPSNVMVGSFGEVQVMDWGLAKVLPRGGAVADASAGRPKDQGTVIVTARTASDDDLSKAGSVMGTPSYMAPEQARGELDQIDERADVFALGSIFCELLTGQPGFTGRNSGEIQRKAARGEVFDAFDRLVDPKHGHDLGLIALAKSCLAPEPEDRPRDAGEVADRLAQHRAQVQDRLRQAELAQAEEKARAEEATKRARVERERTRLTVALAASVLGTMVVWGGGWAYLAREKATRQAKIERTVTKLLDAANLLRGQAKAAPVDDMAKWSEVLATAEQARTSLESGEPSQALRNSIEHLLETLRREQADALHRDAELNRDRKFIEKLESIRLSRAEQFHGEKTDMSYAVAFREFGIDPDSLDLSELVSRIQSRSDPTELAFFIDDWAIIRHGLVKQPQSEAWQKLFLIARDVDKNAWRNDLRSAFVRGEKAFFRHLANDENIFLDQPTRSLMLLGDALLFFDQSPSLDDQSLARKVFTRAWQRSPNDFRLCMALGGLWSEKDRIRFATSAVALRPNSSAAHEILALALSVEGGSLIDMNVEFQEAIRLDPQGDFGYDISLNENESAVFFDMMKDPWFIKFTKGGSDKVFLIYAFHNYKISNDDHNRNEECIKYHNSILKENPQDGLSLRCLALAHIHKGNDLTKSGKTSEGAVEYKIAAYLYRRVIESFPEVGQNHCKLANALIAIGEFDQAAKEMILGIKLNANPDINLLNVLAWYLASSQDAKIRNGKLAVEFSIKANEIMENQPSILNTLAASYAELGDFDAAVNWQRKAIEFEKDEKEKRDFNTRLQLYLDKKAYHGSVPYKP